MKFLNYINESFSENITKERTLEILNTFCFQNFNASKNDIKIFRGDNKWKKDFYLLDKSKRKSRKSVNTYNYYTLMLSEFFNSWKKYPRRDLGIICSTDFKTALYNFGNPYIIIPFDNCNIGICSEFDFWQSFENFKPENLNLKIFNLDIKDTKSSIQKFLNSKIVSFNKKVKLDDSVINTYFIYSLLWFKIYSLQYINNININDLKENLINSQHNLLLTKKLYIDINEKYDKILKNITFQDVLEKMYSPIENNFSLINSINKISGFINREVWFDDSAIAIKVEVFDSLIN